MRPIHYHLPGIREMSGNYFTQGYVIEECDELKWVKWRCVDKWKINIGNAYIMENVLIMSEIHTYAREKVFTSGEEIAAYLESLPRWDKTPYWAKLYATVTPAIRRCDNSRLLNDEEKKEISDKVYALYRKDII